MSLNKLQFKKQNERNYNTELITDLAAYDVSNMIFDEPASFEIPGNPPVTIYRINIATKNEDGKEGNLVIAGGCLKTYGIQEKHDQKSNDLTGYNMSLMLFDDDIRSEQQIALQNFIDRVVEKCKDNLLKNKKLIKRGDMERSDLKKISPIGFLKDKETSESLKDKPILSAALQYAKPRVDKEGNQIEGSIKTIFYEDLESEDNSNPRELQALDLLGKRGYVKPALRIENIFIGPTIKVQVKIVETFIRTEERQFKQNRLLSKLISSISGSTPSSKQASSSPVSSQVDDFADEPSNALGASDNEEDDDKPVVIPVVAARKTKGKK